jgi:signal peptidase I
VNEPDSGVAPDFAAGDPVEAAPPRKLTERRYRLIRWTLEVVVIVAAAFLLALVVQQFVIKPYVIPSPSMEPTLMEGDRVLVNRLVYHFRVPKIGDIIVFHPPGGVSSDPFIKRVVAVGGDTVSVHDGVLWVNGQAQQEPFLMEHPIVEDSPEVKIPSGYVWAMGDNRNNSGDSRVFGPVKLDEIIGEAIAVYWPLNRIKGL